MPVFRLVILLPPTKISFSTTKIALFHFFIVKHDSKGGSRINCVSFGVVLNVHSCLFTSVSIHPVNHKIFNWSLFVGFWMNFWLFDCSKPWLDCCKLISFTWRYFVEDLRKNFVIFLTLFSSIVWSLISLSLVFLGFFSKFVAV